MVSEEKVPETGGFSAFCEKCIKGIIVISQSYRMVKKRASEWLKCEK